MTDLDEIAESIRRARAGDARAAEDLVRRYEPLIRREVRLGLDDARLRRLFDSMDICQSVLGSFFARIASGRYDLDRPERLAGLLTAMARNKLASAARRHARRKRGAGRLVDGPGALEAAVDRAPGPSEVVAWRELMEQFRLGLGTEERRLADLRGEGRPWVEIAEELGGTPGGRRMQLARALARVSREVGLGGVDDA